MNAFFLPSKRGFNFAKIRGFKVTDYICLATSAMAFYLLYKQIVIFHIPVKPANTTSSAIH